VRICGYAKIYDNAWWLYGSGEHCGY
jgi:hypothetical protein